MCQNGKWDREPFERLSVERSCEKKTEDSGGSLKKRCARRGEKEGRWRGDRGRRAKPRVLGFPSSERKSFQKKIGNRKGGPC